MALRKFLLIDHSLRDLSGHHYPYCASVLEAAAEAGMEAVLACHRSFGERAALPAARRVHALFRYPSYSRYTLDTQGSQRFTEGRYQVWRALKSLVARIMRRRLRRAFAEDLGALLIVERLAPGDVVFVATASELDLAGLAQAVRAAPHVSGVQWHLQFHFGIFRARPPQYVEGAAHELALRAAVRTALAGSAPAGLHYHCTTEALSIQYRRLGLGQFTTLPYPVHRAFHPRNRPAAPLRIACLGHARREKGQSHVPALLEQLWQPHLAGGGARLVLQGARQRVRTELEKQLERLQAARPGARAAGSDATATRAIEHVPSGLPLADYAALLCGCDIGVLMYDSARYYDRCSGVLLELLVAGIPVVVPAGSWLAEQIAAPEQRYFERLEQERCTQPGARLELPLDRLGIASAEPTDFALRVPPGTRAVLLSARWRAPRQAGSYLRIGLAGAHGRVLRADAGEMLRALIAVPSDAAVLRIEVANAFAGDPIELTELAALAVIGPPPPLGALGIAIASPAEAAAALDDILRHYAHYRDETARHARDFSQRQSAAAVVAQLLANGAGV